MHQRGLQARRKRKFVYTTNSLHALPVADNVRQRRFHPAAPDRAWTSVVTHVRTCADWLCVATVMDLFSRKIIGWASAPAMPDELVCQAL